MPGTWRIDMQNSFITPFFSPYYTRNKFVISFFKIFKCCYQRKSPNLIEKKNVYKYFSKLNECENWFITDRLSTRRKFMRHFFLFFFVVFTHDIIPNLAFFFLYVCVRESEWKILGRLVWMKCVCVVGVYFYFFFGCVGRALDSPHACSNTLDVSYRAHTIASYIRIQSITRGLKLWKRREREIADSYYNARLWMKYKNKCVIENEFDLPSGKVIIPLGRQLSVSCSFRNKKDNI